MKMRVPANVHDVRAESKYVTINELNPEKAAYIQNLLELKCMLEDMGKRAEFPQDVQDALLAVEQAKADRAAFDKSTDDDETNMKPFNDRVSEMTTKLWDTVRSHPDFEETYRKYLGVKAKHKDRLMNPFQPDLN